MPDPITNRISKTPARYCGDTMQAEDVVPSKGVASWRRQLFEALDLVKAELERRFAQNDLATAAWREATLLAATEGRAGTEDDLVSLKLPDNISVHSLHLQLQMLEGLTKQDKFRTLYDLGTFMSTLHTQTRCLFKDMEQLLRLSLSLPISLASSERSFSALCRLKTWLCNTVAQGRLTHLAVLHIHQDILDTLDIRALMRDFISTTPERKTTFGAIPS